MFMKEKVPGRTLRKRLENNENATGVYKGELGSIKCEKGVCGVVIT